MRATRADDGRICPRVAVHAVFLTPMGKVAIRMPKILIITNDFPPRSGGIQSFVHALATRLPSGRAVVYPPAWRGAAKFDARQPFPVMRHPPSLLLPAPSVARRARATL